MSQVSAARRIPPLPEGTRLVHIGPAKTGTTTVQGALHTCREALATHGVLYAGASRHSRSAMVGAAYAKIPAGYPPDTRERWRVLAREVRESEAKRIVVSSETLARLSPDRARRLVEDLGGESHVLITMRPLANILASRWQQSVQDEMSMGYTDWLNNLFETTPDAVSKPAFWLRYDIAGHVQRWGSVIGAENVTILVLDPQDRGMLLDSFECLLDLPKGTLVPDASLSNASLGHAEVEMLASFNRAFLAHGQPRAEFIRAIRGKTLAGLKANPDGSTSGPIQTPRWAAVRANEAVADWLETVRSSRARVVGVLEHLLVDPDQFEEHPATPTTVPTVLAGQLGYEFYRAGLNYGIKQGRSALRAELAAQSRAEPGTPPATHG